MKRRGGCKKMSMVMVIFFLVILFIVFGNMGSITNEQDGHPSPDPLGFALH